jgi:diguanylate cyclase (GGDEF)-like protein
VYEREIDYVRQFAERAFGAVSGDLTLSQLEDLLRPGKHSPIIQRRRALLIHSRVRMVAATFAVLTPLWIAIDVVFFTWPLWGQLALLRTVATAAFAALALGYRARDDMQSAWVGLGLLLSIPTVFYLISHPMLNTISVGSPEEAIAAGYAYLPFVMVAGLSVFPLTAIEGMAFALPLLLAHLYAGYHGSMIFPFPSYLGAAWLLSLIMVVAALAAMSQLHFMMQLVHQASHDGLTGAFGRRIGEELVRLQVASARRTEQPLAMVFLDLDHFKQINDRFGHDEGDRTLRNVAVAMRDALRGADILVRWGGEEFLIVMPNTDLAGALGAVERLNRGGLGARPDGQPQTASVGVAELVQDGLSDWQALVDRADQRMYRAKQSGRNCVVWNDEADMSDKKFG